MISIGNQALFDCCFVQLNKNVLLNSNQETDDNDNSVNNGSASSKNNKRKSENDILQQTLIQSKIDSVNAVGNKARTLESIAMTRRFHEAVDRYITLTNEISILKKELKQLKKNENNDSSGSESSDSEDEYE